MPKTRTMPFFGDEAGEEGGLERIEAGGIPLGAERRLRELTGGEPLFTSTLGVGEFALLSELNAVPLAQLLGASVHQVGWQYLPWEAQWGGEVFCSLDGIANAWDAARRRALHRLAEEAHVVGADAVVAVRLRRGEHDWSRRSVDYVVSGTGIRYGGSAPNNRPVLTDLSVQEYWKLIGCGWAPAGLVASTAVTFVAQSTRTAWRRRWSWTQNQELDEFSRGFASARDAAVRRLRNQARAVEANGIVGVRFEHRVTREELRVAGGGSAVPARLDPGTVAIGAAPPPTGRDKRRGVVVTIQAVGTAIRRQSAVRPPSPEAVLSPEAVPGPEAVLRLGMAG